jgi:hypothetical protein
MLNFKAHTEAHFYLNAVMNYSIDMAKILVEYGADVNNEDTMDGATAIDMILEYEEKGKKLSDDMKEMENLLLSKEAKAYEERMNQMAVDFRAGEQNRKCHPIRELRG